MASRESSSYSNSRKYHNPTNSRSSNRGWRGNGSGNERSGHFGGYDAKKPRDSWRQQEQEADYNGFENDKWQDSRRDRQGTRGEDYRQKFWSYSNTAEERKFEDDRAKLWASIDFSSASIDAEKACEEKWAEYPKIVKNTYKEHPNVTKWNKEEVEIYRKTDNGITVKVPEGVTNTNEELMVLNPINKFEYAFINFPDIQKLLFGAGFEKPSPIQAQCWPLIMSGYDVIGIAQTGTGKTLAFLLPAYVHILQQETIPEKIPGALVLVLAPTRELAQQIHKEVDKFNFSGIKSICVYGGIPRNKQIQEINKGCNIIIATPGRLDDFIASGNIDITTVTYVVLDEADRMLDCGFEPQIRKTMYKIRPDRQTIMTSATWPPGVQRLANSYMKNPAQVIIGTLDLSAVSSVEQRIEFVGADSDAKLELLFKFIKENGHEPDLKVMVFATSKAVASYVSSELAFRENVNVASIRGDMEQSEREYSIESIKEGRVQYLVATDVASRGIDIPDLTHVINFDFPRDIEEYVHRVGRTGRAGKTGIAITYFTRKDSKHAEELAKILEKADQHVPPKLLQYAEDNVKWMERNGDRRPRRGRYNYDF